MKAGAMGSWLDVVKAGKIKDIQSSVNDKNNCYLQSLFLYKETEETI